MALPSRHNGELATIMKPLPETSASLTARGAARRRTTSPAEFTHVTMPNGTAAGLVSAPANATCSRPGRACGLTRQAPRLPKGSGESETHDAALLHTLHRRSDGLGGKA